ncbi:MAG: 3-oxoadipate enol-lactonase [Methylobacteriaceae bacterium]|nr:3-oxoadipate enol-lactonase [Methylobacteriaceae bacterium]
MPLIQSNGISLFHDLTGPQDAPVVVFSNSLGTALEMWNDVVCALAGRYRCLRYDMRGHGRSQVLDAPARIEDFADDLAGLLSALDIKRAHVVGLSIGGMVAQAFAVRHAGMLMSLTLMATTAHMPPPETWLERAALVRDRGPAAVVDATLGRWFTPDFSARAPHKVAAIRERILATSPIGYAVCCGAIAAMDLRPAIDAIAAPTLIMAGADDPTTPPAVAEDMRAHIKHAELIVLPQARHLFAVERADVVADHLLRFLDRQSGDDACLKAGDDFAAGLAIRKAVLGVEYVQRSLERAGAFAMPWQDFITRTAWGEVWGDPALPWKTRSLLTLAAMMALHREEEFKLHLRPALGNGVTPEELRAMLLHLAVYAGVPAANAAFRWVREELGGEPA